MIIEISVAIIALAFVLLVIYLIITLVELRRVLKLSHQSIVRIESIIKPIDEQTVKLLKTSNAIAENVYLKAAALDPLFNSISKTHHTVDRVFASFKPNGDKSFFTRSCDQTFPVEELLELAAIGMGLWQKYKKRS